MNFYNRSRHTAFCEDCGTQVAPGSSHDCIKPDLPGFGGIRYPAQGARKPNADQQLGDYGELREWDE